MRVVDTTFLIDLARGKDAAIKKAREIESDAPIFCTEISVYEMVIGAHIGEGDPNKMLERLDILLGNFEFLPLNRAAAISAGKIAGNLQRNGEEIGDTDCLIAGIALAHSIPTIVTRNKRHFERIKGITVETY